MLGNVVRQASLFDDDSASSSLRRKKEPWQGMYIEASVDGPRHFVSGETGKLRCSCGKSECVHTEIGEDILFGDGTVFGARFICKSGMHKELRLENAKEAICWSAWFRRFWGNKAPLNYMRKIWSEETCNLDLMVMLDKVEDPEMGIRMFCASRKRWEFEQSKKAFIAFGKGMEQAKRGISDKTAGDTERLRKLFFRDMITMAALSWALEEGDSEEHDLDAILGALQVELVHRLQDAHKLSDDQSRVMLKRLRGPHEDEETILAMLYFDTFSSEMNEFRDKSIESVADVYLPFPKSYVMDYHTARGKAVYRKWLKNGNRIVLEQDLGPIDVRYSGGGMATYWRYCAWEKYGTILMSWKDVIPTKEMRADARGAKWWDE